MHAWNLFFLTADLFILFIRLSNGWLFPFYRLVLLSWGVLLMREFITAPGGTIAGTTARTASGTANWTQHISPTKPVPSIWKWRIHFWDLLTSASIAKQKKIWSKGESPERLTVQRRTAPWPMSGAFLKAQYIQLGLEYYELEDILLPEQLEEF